MPEEPTLNAGVQAADKLGKQVEAGDNAGAAESIQQITALVTHFVARVAQSAKKMLTSVLIVLVLGVLAAAGTAYYFIEVAGWHESWALLPGVAVFVPGVLLLIGVKGLMAVASLPEHIGGLGDSLARVARDHLGELRRLEGKSLKGLVRWKSYVLLAKILWKLRAANDQANQIFGGLMLFGIVANPLFWMVLLGAIITLLIESAAMLLAIAAHAVLF